MQKPDYSKISPELRATLEEMDKKRPENQSLQVLQDVAMMLQELLSDSDDARKATNKTIAEFGAVLTDARESLQTIASKSDPELPDFAKPVVDVINKLIVAVNTKDYSPKIDVKVPDVKVPTPQTTVNVDAPNLSGIEKLLKTEMPKAFEEAISKIPETVVPEYPDRWDEVMEWLESIDTASRMKPVFPTELKVVNPDGSSIGSMSGSTAYEGRNDTTTDTNLVYLGKAVPGSATSDAAWQIKRYDKSAGHMSFADDVVTYTKIWDNRTGYTY